MDGFGIWNRGSGWGGLKTEILVHVLSNGLSCKTLSNQYPEHKTMVMKCDDDSVMRFIKTKRG